MSVQKLEKNNSEVENIEDNNGYNNSYQFNE
jgi:hypothetical protein